MNEFKERALERAKQDSVPKAAKDLGIVQAMLYSWQAKSRQTGQPFEEQKMQQAEITRLKRENARLEEEVAFLKTYCLIVKGNRRVKVVASH